MTMNRCRDHMLARPIQTVFSRMTRVWSVGAVHQKQQPREKVSREKGWSKQVVGMVDCRMGFAS